MIKIQMTEVPPLTLPLSPLGRGMGRGAF